MTSTRLAVVIPDLAVGGLQRMALGLAFALDRTVYVPVVYTFDAAGPLAADLAREGVEHVHLPRRPGVAPGHARVLAERFARDGIGLVHCHNVTALFHGARAAFRAGRLPVLFTEHDREMPAPFRHRVLHRWLARRVHRIVAVSRRLADDLVRWEGFPAGRTSVLVNGIPDPLTFAPASMGEARRALGLDARPVLLTVGSLSEVKNQAALLRIATEVHRRRGGDLHLVLAGDGPLRADLERAARALLPAQDVTFLGNRDDVPCWLAAADVFVLPSHREGLSLALVEAHAMGRPAVAYDVGGNAEVIVHGETGCLVPYPDEGTFASVLETLLAEAHTRGEMGRTARARYLSCFTHERMVGAYAALYDELLAARVA